VAGAHQAAHHVRSHAAQSDHAHLHAVLLSASPFSRAKLAPASARFHGSGIRL
jgi:hypothetical protein